MPDPSPIFAFLIGPIPDWMLYAVLVLLLAGLGICYFSLRYIRPATASERKEVVGLFFQVLGGAVVLVGVYFTWQEWNISKEGQITERFTHAIDQLGKADDEDNKCGKDNDKNKTAPTAPQKNLAIRLGGIYALERIAKDSAPDHPAIMEILTAYVRQKASWQEGAEQSATAAATPHADVQAIVTVIGRRKLTYGNGETQRLDLSGTNLRWANLSEANLDGVVMRSAHLENANLKGAKLRGANLLDVRLRDAFLDRADLSQADLRGAVLAKASLGGTILARTDLRGADLRDAIGLTQPQLDLAITDASTMTTGLKTRVRP